VKYSIWLTFAETDEAYLTQIIQALSKEYSAPAFRPHCTVFSPWELDPDYLVQTADWNEFGEFSAEMSRLNHSDWIWKTVFIELKQSQELTRINQQVSQLSSERYTFQPHISLIYKKMDGQKRQELCDRLELKPTYTFTNFEIVDTSGPVSEWRTHVRIPLTK
jgi:2'-5' RNA ligase